MLALSLDADVAGHAALRCQRDVLAGYDEQLS